MPAEPRWGSIPDAAKYYGVSERTVRRWITDGLVEGKRLGPRLIRVNLASLEQAGRPLQYRGGAA